MSSEVLVGRQPIYNINLNVIAYELLFRSKRHSNKAVFSDGDKATTDLILKTFLEIGLNNIVGKLPAFINLTRNFINNISSIPFSKEDIVLEILEDISIDDEIANSIKHLKQQGYTLALDDYRFNEDHLNIIEYIDIVKIDILEFDHQHLEKQVKKFHGLNVKLLAEKIETYEEFEFCKSLKFDYYQGFFLSKPKIYIDKKIPENRQTLLSIIAKLYDPETSLSDINEHILSHTLLKYRFLQFLNCEYFDQKNPVENIEEALDRFALEDIKFWLTIISIKNLSEKPEDLFNSTLLRAKMCELLAKHQGIINIEDFFAAGIISNLPALIDINIEEILKSIALKPNVKQAVLASNCSLGKTLKFCINYEQYNWDQLTSINTETDKIKDCYLKSILWTNNLLQYIKT